MKPINRKLILTLIILVLFFSVFTLVQAFAEEAVYFIDPIDDTVSDDQVSTIHFDISYILAIAAGFNENDAHTIQIYNQLVDSEQVGAGDTASYSNCYGAFKPQVNPNLVCEIGTDTADVIWPLWDMVQAGNEGDCTTSRFGPYSPFFHFPRNKPEELGMLHDWGWGYRDDLIGYSAYAWDGFSVLTANCAVVQPETIETGLEAGSLEAFGTYLHSMADYYSHRDCLEALANLPNPPLWGTHTLIIDVPECNYNPALPNNTDAHGREFGSAFPEDSARTDEAVLATYEELVKRSLTKEGMYYPLPLDTVLTTLDGNPTLQEALYQFVHTWNYSDAALRRQFGEEILNAINLAERTIINKVFLPVTLQ